MYRALFIFDIAEIHWRLTEVLDKLRVRKPSLHSWKKDQLELAWLKHYLKQYHHVVFYPAFIDQLIEQIDSECYNSDHPLVRSLYRQFDPAIRPDTHPCFHSRCHLQLVGTTVTLEYPVTD